MAKEKIKAPKVTELEGNKEHEEAIEVYGARVHNLKNIDISIPKK
ncbi:MAG: hypothetical protein JWQ96_2876 [Segetibacter sp.]|nr:hypothetical protein [Segetibacter sp.]